MSRHHRPKPLEKKELKEYSVQATPFAIRDLGWDFLTTLAEAVYPKFEDKEFRPLIFRLDGTTVLDALGQNEPIKVFYAPLKEFTDVDSDQTLMIVPYRDKEGIKVLYFKWAEETIYDSFSVPDGQNRVWDNREKK